MPVDFVSPDKLVKQLDRPRALGDIARENRQPVRNVETQLNKLAQQGRVERETDGLGRTMYVNVREQDARKQREKKARQPRDENQRGQNLDQNPSSLFDLLRQERQYENSIAKVREEYARLDAGLPVSYEVTGIAYTGKTLLTDKGHRAFDIAGSEIPGIVPFLYAHHFEVSLGHAKPVVRDGQIHFTGYLYDALDRVDELLNQTSYASIGALYRPSTLQRIDLEDDLVDVNGNRLRGPLTYGPGFLSEISLVLDPADIYQLVPVEIRRREDVEMFS